MKRTAAAALTWALLAGCGSGDDRLAQVAMEATRQQAEQNARMAESQRQVAAGARQLVEADARARQEIAGMQREVAGQMAEASRQRDRLDDERRALGAERRRESLLGPIMAQSLLVLACLLPLVICVLVLWPRPEPPETGELSTLLVRELVVSPPRLTASATGANRAAITTKPPDPGGDSGQDDSYGADPSEGTQLPESESGPSGASTSSIPDDLTGL